jgi:hypothetical protein
MKSPSIRPLVCQPSRIRTAIMKQKMNFVRFPRTVSLLSLIVLVSFGTARAQTPTFTYQGRLTDAVNPASTYEMQFSLFGSLAGNDQIGSTITNSSVAVTGGVFTVQLDFSPATPFTTGADRWLQIAVRKASDPPGFTTLTPRQQITSSPYSIRTLSANAADSLSSACVGCVTDAHVNSVSGSKLTGTVAVPNGGTGATTLTGILHGNGTGSFNALTTSAGIAGAISNETGSGALVFASSPSLITPNLGAATATSLTVTNPIAGSVTGNAATATALQTARTINGTLFDGTLHITVPAAAGTLTGTTLAAGVTSSSLTSVGNLGSLTVNGSTTLGDGASDTVTINAGPLNLPNATSAADGLVLGGDANLYRSASNTLKTDDALTVAANTTLGDSSADTVTINAGPVNLPNATSAADGLLLGGDANLYRVAADALRTDDSLAVGGNATIFGTLGLFHVSEPAAATIAVTRSVLVLGSGTAVDNLTGGTGGQILIIRVVSGVVTINDASTNAGNIQLAGGNNLSLSENDTLLLVSDGLGKWLEISRSEN